MFGLGRRTADGDRGGGAARPAGAGRSRCPRPTRCSAPPLAGPWPAGTEVLYVAMGCFWGAERIFWRQPGVVSTAVGLPRRVHALPDVRGGVHRADRPHRGGAGRLRPGARPPPSCCSRRSGRTTTPPRRTGRATTSAPSTARASTGPTPAQEQAARATRGRVPAGPHRPRARHDLHRDPPLRRRRRRARRRPVLLRRGLPPAVPAQEPRRVLQPRPQRDDLPGRARAAGPGPAQVDVAPAGRLTAA